MKRVCVVGIQGVPSKYGGFETLVENLIGEVCSDNVEYYVFCSAKDMVNTDLKKYKRANLIYVKGLRANGIQSILYDVLCLVKCIGKNYESILCLGVSGCLFLPIFKIFSRSKVIVNIDGLEHKREKWGKFARFFLKLSESCAVKYADTIVSDNEAIRRYVSTQYGINSEMIAYGGDQAIREVDNARVRDILSKYGLERGKYALSICRIEPENNCKTTLEAFSNIPFSSEINKLVIVGNWSRNEYGKNLFSTYGKVATILLLPPIYDLDILYVLRSCSGLYIHGHSAGGTNPSLVEAMQFPLPIFAFDCDYNRATTHNMAVFYKDSEDLREKIINIEYNKCIGKRSQAIGVKEYTWSKIAKQYESLY